MYTATTGIRDRERHPVVECMDVLRYLDIQTHPIAFRCSSRCHFG